MTNHPPALRVGRQSLPDEIYMSHLFEIASKYIIYQAYQGRLQAERPAFHLKMP